MGNNTSEEHVTASNEKLLNDSKVLSCSAPIVPEIYQEMSMAM